MNRITMCVLAVTGCAVALASDIPPPREVVDVAALVRQLGNDDFAEREAAERRLSTLKVDEVPPELLAALKSPNLEVRERSERAIKALRGRIALGKLPHGERFAKRGQIDLYVASTAAGDPKAKADDPRLWEPAFESGLRAVESAGLKGDRKPQGGPTWFKDYPTFRKAYPGLRFLRTDDLYAPPRKGTPGTTTG